MHSLDVTFCVMGVFRSLEFNFLSEFKMQICVLVTNRARGTEELKFNDQLNASKTKNKDNNEKREQSQ